MQVCRTTLVQELVDAGQEFSRGCMRTWSSSRALSRDNVVMRLQLNSILIGGLRRLKGPLNGTCKAAGQDMLS
jgi:hypothetical protein